MPYVYSIRRYAYCSGPYRNKNYEYQPMIASYCILMPHFKNLYSFYIIYIVFLPFFIFHFNKEMFHKTVLLFITNCTIIYEL